MTRLSLEQIQELTQFDTPTICNAIERFGLRSRVEGFMKPEIWSRISLPQTMVGYACTAKIGAAKAATTEQPPIWMAYYETLQQTPRPSIAVIEDIDPEPIGSFWGEVNATVHKSLGCIGTITNGGVRDLKEVAELGFGMFAKQVLVSHGYVHIEEFNTPVTLAGLTVHPGDLLAADQHGVVLIPAEVADQLAEACRQAADAELPVLNYVRACLAEDREVDLEKLREARAEMARLRQK